MCIVCKEWIQGKLTNAEALSNVGELIGTAKNDQQKKHYWAVSDAILDKEMNNVPPDPELERQWTEEMYGDD